jgi:transcriptional regulator with XRE-family HTH domain
MFGERLAQARERKGWSQTDLASRTGLMPAAISHFECGRREPSLYNLCRLIEALGCDANELLGVSNAAARAGEGKP